MLTKLRPHHIAAMLENKFDNFNAFSQDLINEGHTTEVVAKIIGIFRQLVADVMNQIEITAIDIPGEDAVCAVCERKKVCESLSNADARKSTDRIAVHKYRLKVGEVYGVQELISRHALTVRF